MDGINRCSCNDFLALTLVAQHECAKYTGGLEWVIMHNHILYIYIICILLYYNIKCNSLNFVACFVSNCQCGSDFTSLRSSDCVGPALTYNSRYFRFDSTSEAFFAVFLVFRGAEWDNFLQNVFKKLSGGSLQFSQIQNLAVASVFFIVTVLIGQFFLVSLLTSIVISTYLRYCNEDTQLLLNVDAHKNLQQIHKFLEIFRRRGCRLHPLPTNSISEKCFRFVQSKEFHWFIFACIVANAI
ncbi:hypothetical protein RFI_19539, partial [Reticulomyxa filosa]